MKYRFYKGLMLGALLLAGSLPALHAQGFSVPWFVVADGGGTTGAGIFSLTGTFGQWEANEQPLAGGNFSLTGGFWSFLAAEPAPGASNSASAIALSGDLAFGGVALETSSNLTFTISNAGNSTLTITNIRYPAGFSGSSFGQILAGGAQSVTVTFSPTDVIVYGGAVTVSSDETNGIGSIPISGYGASGALTLIVITKGDGTVSPNLNGKLLRAGTKHNLTATAKSGNVFSNWTGSIITNKNPLTFTMEVSTLLQANFISNPFLPVKGTYNGLFFATNGVTEETAGMLKGLTVGTKGTYSGALLINGGRHAISGSFDLSGRAGKNISRAAKQGGPLAAEMTLNWNDSPPQITGTVSGTNNGTPWVANLLAHRSTNNSSAEYTMLLAPTELGLAGVPPGYGYVLMAKHAGVLALSGALADGTVLSQTVPVAETGGVPVYASLYRNTGLLMGWVNMAGGAPSGNLDWIKKAASHPLLYPNGFTNSVVAQGASWTNRSPAPAIDLSAGQLNISGGTLLSPLSFNVAVSDKDGLTKSAEIPTNSLTGSINPKTGLLTVRFGNGDGKATTLGKGAVLQDTTNAGGFFLDKTNAGSITLDL